MCDTLVLKCFPSLLKIYVNHLHVLCLSDVMRYDEMEFDEESEPEIPIYNRAELIERYQVMISGLSSVEKKKKICIFK